MNYAKCATCHGLNSMGFCQYTACRFPSTESGVINGSAYVAKIVTNADRIRSMSDEELAMLIHDIVQAEMWRAQVRECITTETGWLDWLREEVPTNG